LLSDLNLHSAFPKLTQLILPHIRERPDHTRFQHQWSRRRSTLAGPKVQSEKTLLSTPAVPEPARNCAALGEQVSCCGQAVLRVGKGGTYQHVEAIRDLYAKTTWSVDCLSRSWKVQRLLTNVTNTPPQRLKHILTNPPNTVTNVS
jgi:hypothetical protein